MAVTGTFATMSCITTASPSNVSASVTSTAVRFVLSHARSPAARDLHSSTFQLNVTHFLLDKLGGASPSVTKAAQVELGSGRV